MKKLLLTIFVSLMWCCISIAETKYYPNGEEYTGEFKDGKRDGQGTLVYSIWKKYVGEWKDDKKHGQGTYIDEIDVEHTYVGEWINDKKNGYGIIKFLGGAIYDGEWKDDKENGKGTVTLQNGKIYTAGFKNGFAILTNEESIIYENGEIFYGEYKNGKKHDHGTLILPNGRKIPGIWVNGMLVESKETSQNSNLLLQNGHELKRRGYLNGAVLLYKKSLEADQDSYAAKSSLESILQEVSIIKIVKSLDPVCQNSSDDFDTIKFCLEKHFFYKKNPVHPQILNDLLPFLSDSGDIIISINLSDAFGSNQYCCEKSSTELNEGRARVRLDYPDTNGFIIYSYLGATDNGAMVIKTWENGGGSGIFSNLLIIKVKKRLGANFDLFNSEGVIFDKQQIVLEKLLSIALGDRTETNISINVNSVTINDKTINIPSY
ncbi:hypothetical protein OAS60_02070 [Candidatus Pelagibacter sp.]|nr:hypothetical protein [Candidatus Pelagibacter sp.]